MRIVHVVESLEIGGLERVVVDLAAEQMRAGHSVAVICLCLLGALAPEATQKKIVVFNAAKRDGIDLRALWRMRSFIRRFGPDVLHTHNAVAHYYAAMAGLLAGIAPTLNTRHGMGSWNASARREMLYRLAMTVTRYGVCVCYAAQNAFLERGILPKRKAVVVPNGIDTSRFEPQNVSGRERLAVELGIQLQSVSCIFGTVGRLNAAKDHATLLAAAAVLATERRDFRVLIIGDGELRAGLLEKAQQMGLQHMVIFAGARSDVPELLPGFDVFVLSSITEGYSLALVEASATGLPILATRVGGNAEIVRERVTGMLVPPQDPAALAAAMKELLEKPQTREELGRNARDWALQNSSTPAMYQSYLTLYRSGSQKSDSGVRA